MKILLMCSLCTFALSSGFLAGKMLSLNPQPIVLLPKTRYSVPTVHIDGIRNGLLHGAVYGNARVVLGDTVLTQSGTFVLDASSLQVNTVEILIPEGMYFVASTRGKKYYPVFSAAGSRIVPGNRIYFATESDAVDAGYVP